MDKRQSEAEFGRTFKNRIDAGQQLSRRLTAYAHRDDVVVLALPRGGVPVGYEVAKALKVPLDVLVVRKLGFPGQEELAIGAVASGGIAVYNPDLIAVISNSNEVVSALVAKASEEVARREIIFRAERPPVEIGNKTIILVDDGVATGATMRAAITALRMTDVKQIIAAVPVASSEAYQMLQDTADEAICLWVPTHFAAVGQFYVDFSQTSDKEVVRLLTDAARCR